MSTPAEIRNAASKVLAAHMDDIECIETLGRLRGNLSGPARRDYEKLICREIDDWKE